SRATPSRHCNASVSASAATRDPLIRPSLTLITSAALCYPKRTDPNHDLICVQGTRRLISPRAPRARRGDANNVLKAVSGAVGAQGPIGPSQPEARALRHWRTVATPRPPRAAAAADVRIASHGN